MDIQRAFLVLGIEETKDEEAVKAAYRGKLVTVNPEDNPEGFKRLRQAYEEALSYTKAKETAGGEAETPATVFIKRLDDLYQSLPDRLDAGKWEALLKDELLDDLEYGEEAKWRLFSYLAGHYRMPAKIWRVLGRVFGMQERVQEFKEHLPENFVDFMLLKISDDGGDGEFLFPYDAFVGAPRADYDGFINDFNLLRDILGREQQAENREQWLKEAGQKIAGMDSYGISHPWFTMEKAKYALALGRQEEAVQLVHDLWEAVETDNTMLLDGARILTVCGREAEAEALYQGFLKRAEEKKEESKKKKSASVYNVLVALAEICLGQERIVEAREYVLRAERLYQTATVQKLLADCNNRLISFYTCDNSPAKGSECLLQRQEALTAEEGIRLAWCFIQNQRAEEGYAYFQEHPVLKEDTAECHRVKATLFFLNNYAEDALAETRAWRQKLSEEPEEDGSAFREAQSYEAEGRCLAALYWREREAAEAKRNVSEEPSEVQKMETKAAESLKAAALEAYDRALLLQPEEIDFLMSKMIFLRAIKDYTSMAELCQRMMEVDKGFFWAYFYAQEAYEALGKAQQVVDTFYAARKIYAGRPEMYERAARVFWDYRQYRDVKNIFRQAKEAGVDSPFLQLKRLGLMRLEARDEEELREADAYAGKILKELEDKRAAEEDAVPAQVLADIYIEAARVHENELADSFRDAERMEEWLKKALALDDSLWNRYYLGRFYLIEKRMYKESYQQLKLCEERGMQFEWMYYFIARCHENFKQWDDAIVYYKKAVEKAPDNADFVWRIAWLYRAKFRRTEQDIYRREALKYLDIQVEKFGESARELWQYSDIHSRVMEYDKALEEINRALALKGQNPVYWGHKGMLLELLGREEEAVPCYEKGIEIDAEQGSDYEYGYKQVYNMFCRQRRYAEAIVWLEAQMDKIKTESCRSDNLDRIRFLYCMLGNKQKALETVEQGFGGSSLTDYVCDSWEQEGERIENVLDAYSYLQLEEEYRERTKEAVLLLESAAGNGLKEDREAKRGAYMEIAHYYAISLAMEKALFYYQKALEHADPSETDRDDYERILDCIMRCLWRMGRAKEAKQYGEKYLESLGETYKECAELGKTVEEFHGETCYSRRNCLYDLFVISFFGGEYEKAEGYLKQMEDCCWCALCIEKGCTEEWECKGYMALAQGNSKEAADCFRQALAVSLRDNFDARVELKRMGMEVNRNGSKWEWKQRL